MDLRDYQKEIIKARDDLRDLVRQAAEICADMGVFSRRLYQAESLAQSLELQLLDLESKINQQFAEGSLDDTEKPTDNQDNK